MRVVFTILDALPNRFVGPVLTPNIWQQVLDGGRAPAGGRSLDVAVTYSNHAAFVTGRPPQETGLWGNAAWVDGAFLASYDAGPRAPTLFDRCTAAGLTSTMISGDHKLIRQMGAGAATAAWPPDGDLPPGTPLDPFGYPTNDAVVAAARNADAAGDLDVDFVVLQLNEPDTTEHIHGPESTETQATIAATDTAYGELITLLQPRWDDTVLITVSDHEQEQITDPEGVHLRGALRDLPVEVVHDGTAALIRGDIDLATIRAVEGVESARLLGSAEGADMWMAWTVPGRSFGKGEVAARGQHGSPRTQTQVAIISGGHPRAAGLARQIETEQPTTLTWAPLIADLLGL